jgi:hypothetical protein
VFAEVQTAASGGERDCATASPVQSPSSAVAANAAPCQLMILLTIVVPLDFPFRRCTLPIVNSDRRRLHGLNAMASYGLDFWFRRDF